MAPGSASPQATPKATPKRVGKRPRLEKYARLISRFYEPLVLLKILGKTRGQHTIVAEAPGTLQRARRRLLDTLAYLCDYGKGGQTTAAVALEERQNCYVFWVASNGTDAHEVMKPFLESIIDDLRRLLNHPGDKDRERFVTQCISFAKERVRKERGLLLRMINHCENHLQQAPSATDLRISRWLRLFHEPDIVKLCYLAYDQRKSHEFKEITRRGCVSDGTSNPTAAALVYTRLRHILGRLGHHVRAPKQVIEDSGHLYVLFEKDASRVQAVEAVPSVPRPEADNMTWPMNMLDRMVRCDDQRKAGYKEALASMDQRLNISERIQQQYQLRSFQPCVHAEVQVLEHFYSGWLAFVQDDRYIGASKPACYCCELYFRSHPLICATPRSHQNIYLNWGPPLLAGGGTDPKYKHQLHILNAMLETIRRDALDQISRQAASPQAHPDSTTGITPSVFSVPISSSAGDADDLEEKFMGLSILASDDLGEEDEEEELEYSDTHTLLESDYSTNSPVQDWISEDEDEDGGGVQL